MADSPEKKIFVYGSCVSRDTIDFLDPSTYELSGYVARHSIIAEYGDCSKYLPEDLKLDSAFQRRMILNDWSENALEGLFSSADNIDLLLLDLIDERHGVYRVEGEKFVTRSIDLLQSETALEVSQNFFHIPFGSNEHFDVWAQRAEYFVIKLRDSGLLHKTRLIKINWAELTLESLPAPSSMGITAVEANAMFERYYQHFIDLGVPVVEVPQEIVRADPKHKWGLAPFHYSNSAYLHIIKSLGLKAKVLPLHFQQLEMIDKMLAECNYDYFREGISLALAGSLKCSGVDISKQRLTPESGWLMQMLLTDLSEINWSRVWIYRGKVPVFEILIDGATLAFDINISKEDTGFELRINTFLRGDNLVEKISPILPEEFLGKHSREKSSEIILKSNSATLMDAYNESRDFMRELLGYLVV